MAEYFVWAPEVLPATAFVAIVLFILKTVLDWWTNRLARKRRTKALKLLMSEECERNHWSLKTFFSSLEEYRDRSGDEGWSADVSHHGTPRITVTKRDGSYYGHSLPSFHTNIYHRVLPSLAEADSSLFLKVSDYYEHLVALEEYRASFYAYLNGEGDEPFRLTAAHFFIDLAQDKDEELQKLRELYKTLSGKTLGEHQWRLS